jgi:Ca2+-binding RTX toxin-like protein
MIVQGGAVIQAGALVLGGGGLSVDEFSSLEVGTLGTGVVGTLTVDPGYAVSGEGMLNVLGLITDNGTITAQGGTLAVGAVSGIGTVGIAAESALSLTDPMTVPVDFAGAGGTLIVDTTADLPTGPIEGFAPGDSILVSGSPVAAVAYQPGTGGIGTLTLLEAGQAVGTLVLAGNYAGDLFAVTPDGNGAAITVAVNPGGGIGGPPPGTTTPDQYLWTGAGGVLWSSADSWQDTTQGQASAAVAPGQNDLVTIQAAGAATQSVTGPGDAALLTLTGTVALGGLVAAGTLAVGTTQQTGVLALGGGDVVTAGSAEVLGGVEGQGGTLTVAGVLSLGAAGVVDATAGSAIGAGAVLMQGVGSSLLTDSTSTIEIGGNAGATAGSITVDPGGVVSGSGTVDAAGLVVDDGLVQANGGTLVLGAVSGTGTLLVGLGADLVVGGAAGPGLTVDFAGAGTLTLEQAGFSAAIENFGPSDTIILPVSGATSAAYALEAPGEGILTILDGSQVVQTQTLLGSYGDEVFNVAGSSGNGTVLLASPATPARVGGDTVPSDYPYPTLQPGSNQWDATDIQNLAHDDFPYAYAFVAAMDPNQSCDLWYLEDGETTVGAPIYGGADQPAGKDFELVQTNGNNEGSPTNYVLQAGYDALIAVGNQPVNLFDQDVGNALLVGNVYTGPSEPTQPTQLVTFADGDTLVGAAGANTVFWAAGSNGVGTESVSIQGGGNDTIVTNQDDASVTTSGGGRSLVFLGSSDNFVNSQGADTIICSDTLGGIAQDTIDAGGGLGQPGPTVYGPSAGEVIVYGDASDPVVVGGGGELVLHGGSSSGNVMWTGSSNAFYFGGTGSAVIVGGSGYLYVQGDEQGGGGPITVYGGTGMTTIEGVAGNSAYVVGEGVTSVAAGAGNTVWVDGSAPVTVTGASGLVVYAGQGTGSYVFDASAGSETLWGGAGSDQFIAGTGNDQLISGGGADSFKFTNGLAGGTDVIYNFRVGLDTIILQAYGSGIPAMSVQNGNTYFSLTDGTHVEVVGVSNLTASSFNLT